MAFLTLSTLSTRLCLAVLGLFVALGISPVVQAQTLTTYGTPGLVEMPTAQVLPDGTLALTSSYFGATLCNSLTFQVLPRIYGTFRYATIRGFDPGGPTDENRFDRSFDLHYQITDETDVAPAIGVGLRDLGGTGLYSSEYLVATKSFGARLTATAGIGWGRLAQTGSFSNPLGGVSDRFKTRPEANEGGIAQTGQLDFGLWFRGRAAGFAGIEYQATARLSLQFEYSSDAYDRETSVDIIDVQSPFNIGLNYAFDNGSHLRAYAIGGTEIGLQYSLVINPAKRLQAGGLESAPLPIAPRNRAILAGFDLSQTDIQPKAQTTLAQLFGNEGLVLHGLAVTVDRAAVRMENRRWDIEAQALGRAARAMAASLPASVEVFEITFQTSSGVAISSVTLTRSDLEDLAMDYDGAWKSQASSVDRCTMCVFCLSQQKLYWLCY